MTTRTILFLLFLISTTLSISKGQNQGSNNNNTNSTELIDCPLCANETHTPQDPFSIFVAGDATMTCQTAYELGPIQLPKENCTFWQSRGTNICQCAAEPPQQNLCTLCDDGQSLPDPFLQISPSLVCAQLQIQARRDDPDVCTVWQQTYGIYCGCNNTLIEDNLCRVCDDTPELFDPMASTTVTNKTLSCGEIEFDANLPQNNNNGQCQEDITKYAKDCCREPPTATPSLSPTVLDSDDAIVGNEPTKILMFLNLLLVTLILA